MRTDWEVEHSPTVVEVPHVMEVSGQLHVPDA
jgi:hypothetical protein